jgi:hypothetical protein
LGHHVCTCWGVFSVTLHHWPQWFL